MASAEEQAAAEQSFLEAHANSPDVLYLFCAVLALLSPTLIIAALATRTSSSALAVNTSPAPADLVAYNQGAADYFPLCAADISQLCAAPLARALLAHWSSSDALLHRSALTGRQHMVRDIAAIRRVLGSGGESSGIEKWDQYGYDAFRESFPPTGDWTVNVSSTSGVDKQSFYFPMTLEPQSEVTPLNNTPTGASSYTSALYYTGEMPLFQDGWPTFDDYVSLTLPDGTPFSFQVYSCISERASVPCDTTPPAPLVDDSFQNINIQYNIPTAVPLAAPSFSDMSMAAPVTTTPVASVVTTVPAATTSAFAYGTGTLAATAAAPRTAAAAASYPAATMAAPAAATMYPATAAATMYPATAAATVYPAAATTSAVAQPAFAAAATTTAATAARVATPPVAVATPAATSVYRAAASAGTTTYPAAATAAATALPMRTVYGGITYSGGATTGGAASEPVDGLARRRRRRGLQGAASGDLGSGADADVDAAAAAGALGKAGGVGSRRGLRLDSRSSAAAAAAASSVSAPPTGTGSEVNQGGDDGGFLTSQTVAEEKMLASDRSPPPPYPPGQCNGYFRKMTFMSAATLLAIPPREGTTLPWTIQLSGCDQESVTLSLQVSEQDYTADLNLEPWPGAPPPWCQKWGYQDLFPGQAYPNYTSITLRSAGDPYAVAGQLSECSFQIRSEAEADEVNAASVTGGGFNMPMLGGGVGCGAAALGMWLWLQQRKKNQRLVARNMFEGTPLTQQQQTASTQPTATRAKGIRGARASSSSAKDVVAGRGGNGTEKFGYGATLRR